MKDLLEHLWLKQWMFHALLIAAIFSINVGPEVGLWVVVVFFLAYRDGVRHGQNELRRALDNAQKEKEIHDRQ